MDLYRILNSEKLTEDEFESLTREQMNDYLERRDTLFRGYASYVNELDLEISEEIKKIDSENEISLENEITIDMEDNFKIHKTKYFVTFTLDQTKWKFENSEKLIKFEKVLLEKLNSKSLADCKIYYVIEHPDSNIHAHVLILGAVRSDWFRWPYGYVDKQKMKGSFRECMKYMSKESKVKKILN